MEELDSIYQKALEKLKDKYSSLLEEYSPLEEKNPIERISYRIKKIDSIEEKLNKKNIDINKENVRELNDVVGVRIVCSFLNDMSEIIKRIENDSEIKILNCKNYIDKPKNNGYMSYHLNIEIPIVFNGKTEFVKAEIQVRTIAMDMWASLEHKIWYKKGIELPDDMNEKIYNTAEMCKRVDRYLNYLACNAKEKDKINELKPNFMLEPDYKLFKNKYNRALQILEDKINSISEEYDNQNEANPIEYVKCRLKTDEAISLKLKAKSKKYPIDYSISSTQKYINDIAGIRIVCPFKSDLKETIKLIKNDSTIKIISEKDYIENPKESGYRAYHLLVGVPVYLEEKEEIIKVEVQIRTIAMDMWASLEHKLCYHKSVDNKVKEELSKLSKVIKVVDDDMEISIIKSRKLIKARKIIL